MAITPADIQAQTFSEAKRGYDPAEVDVFLERLASEVDAMLNKIVDLKTRLTAAEQELAAAQTQAQAAPAPVLHRLLRPLRIPSTRLRQARSPLRSSRLSSLPTTLSPTLARTPTAFAPKPTPRLVRSFVRLSPRSRMRSTRSIVSRLPVRSSSRVPQADPALHG